MQRPKPIIILSKEKVKEKSAEVVKKEEANNIENNMIFGFALIGDTGVGKSCLILRFIKNTYDDSYISTIGYDFMTKIIHVNDRMIKARVWDLSSNVSFRVYSSNYFNPQAILLVFDLSDKATFLNLETHIERHFSQCSLDRFEKKGFPTIVLVGSKADEPSKREISKIEIEEYMAKSRYDIDAYVEVSSKTGENVNELFNVAARMVASKNNLIPSPPSPTIGDRFLSFFGINANKNKSEDASKTLRK